MADNGNITDTCTGRKGLHLNFSGAIQLVKNFASFMKTFWSVKGCSGISNLIPESAHPLTLLSDRAFESSKTAVLSNNDISHCLSRNVSESDNTTYQSAEA